MSEIDRKIQDRKLQLGSLNDELKDTVKTIEEKHLERDETIKATNDLKLELEEEKKKLIKAKEGHASELTLHTQRVKDEKLKLQMKQEEIGELVNFALKLKSKEGETKRSIEKLKAREKELTKTTKDLDKNKTQLREVRYEVKSSEVILKQQTKDIEDENETLHILRTSRVKLGGQIETQKTSHKEWLDRTKTKAELDEKSLKNLVEDYESKHRDLRIVKARLKKLWPSDKPFPKLWQEHPKVQEE